MELFNQSYHGSLRDLSLQEIRHIASYLTNRKKDPLKAEELLNTIADPGIMEVITRYRSKYLLKRSNMAQIYSKVEKTVIDDIARLPVLISEVNVLKENLKKEQEMNKRLKVFIDEIILPTQRDLSDLPDEINVDDIIELLIDRIRDNTEIVLNLLINDP